VITIFSTPKRFEGLFAVIQENAIASWMRLGSVEVILFGNEEGTSAIAQRFGLRHVPVVETTDRGLPLISAMFDRTQALASGDLLCYVNADVILMEDAVRAARRAQSWRERFLMVARRRDLDIRSRLDFREGWDEELRRDAQRNGRLMSEVSIDWFVFPRGQYNALLPLAVGRPGWDNWLLWHTVNSGWPLIDGSAFVTLVHQRHDYSHAGGTKNAWHDSDAQRNQTLVGHWSRYYTISHAGWMLTADGEVKRARGFRYALAKPRRLLSQAFRFTRPLRNYVHARRLARPL
jgi:hypothetical protein